MVDFLDEKWLLEENAALALVEILNIQQGNNYKILMHEDRPDIVIENQTDGKRLGVEVTHLFYDSEEARYVFGRSSQQNFPPNPQYIEEYVRRLNLLLQQKSEKAKGYNHDYPLALLIRVVSPLFHLCNFKVYADSVVVPSSDFDIIWLMFYDFEERRWTLLKRLR